MASPTNKRRKLEHASSGEEEDATSFASFGSGDEDDEMGDISDRGLNGAELDADDVLDNDEDDMSDATDDAPDANSTAKEREVEATSTSTRTYASTSTPSSSTQRQPAPTPRPQSSSYSANTFKSSLFKLQVDELLEQIRPRHGKRETEAEEALHKVKKVIEKIPNKEALPVEDAEKDLLKSGNTKVLFPNPRPPKDAKYKLSFAKPAGINVVGSYALKIASRAEKTVEVDMIVVMPSSMFQDKDYLNYRYFYKRSYYLACLAAGLEDAQLDKYEMRYENLHDNPLKPVLLITPKVMPTGGSIAPTARWRIAVQPCVADDVFIPDKLLPNKNCVRNQGLSASANIAEEQGGSASPFYNSSLRSDMLESSQLKLLHGASKTCEAFRDACLLGSTWLRQRGLGSSLGAGGFGAAEWSTLIALFLQGGGPQGKPILSDRYSSYQLLKATLQVLAARNLVKQPLAVGSEATIPNASDEAPMIWDAERFHNVLYKMTPWSYKKLRQEAKTTLNMLGHPSFDGFEAAFILRKDNVLYEYDHVIELRDLAIADAGTRQDHLVLDTYKSMYDVLQRGLGDRVRQIAMMPQSTKSWTLDHADRGRTDQKLLIGIIVNPETVDRAIDHGPPAEQKSKAAEFRQFWGDKAELRRFKDGSILETLVWTDDKDGRSILEQIVRHLIRRHIGSEAEHGLRFTDDILKKMIPHGSNITAYAPIMDAFKQLETDIRNLEGLPLSIRQISPADSQLRYASRDIPSKAQSPKPADVVLQFEGSARWPDDLVAIQRTKIAFLLKLSESMQDSVDAANFRIGLENEDIDILNQAFLDVAYDSGAAFRVRIHHDREQTLLERKLKDKTLSPIARDAAVLGLAKYKMDYIKAPAHTQAFAGLCSRHPALSGTVRVVKELFASHLLAHNIADEVIELIVARTFVQPWPWETPSSVETGFYRTLHWLSRWDWRKEPLIVDLSGGSDLKQPQTQSIVTKFEAWRKLDPALNRMVLFAASNVDPDGTTWSDGRPAKVVAGRMTALVKAARAEIEGKQLQLRPDSLFVSPFYDFDFVLHLDPTLFGKKRKQKSSNQSEAAYKNLELSLDGDLSTAGFDPVLEFSDEMERLYGSCIVFFSGGHTLPVVAGLWNPQTATRPWTLNLSYSTTPIKRADSEKIRAEVNKNAILAEIAKLGGDLIQKIEVNSH